MQVLCPGPTLRHKCQYDAVMNLRTTRCALAGSRRTAGAHNEKMTNPVHGFAEGDRVRAPRRPQFPQGTVIRLMNGGYLLVRWDGDVLETAHHTELEKAGGSAGGS
jgi:hypothetical protein